MTLFKKSCSIGWARGCGRLGESYLWGEGTEADLAKALVSFELACRNGYGPSCFNAGLMYRRGMLGQPDETVALQRLRRACELGIQKACQSGESPVVAGPGPAPDASGRGDGSAGSRF